MALQKNLLGSNGVVTTYHRVEDVFFTHDRSLSCTMNSYVSKEYANIPYNRVDSSHFSFDDISIEEEESVGIRKLAYTKIKHLDQWKDSIDC